MSSLTGRLQQEATATAPVDVLCRYLALLIRNDDGDVDKLKKLLLELPFHRTVPDIATDRKAALEFRARESAVGQLPELNRELGQAQAAERAKRKGMEAEVARFQGELDSLVRDTRARGDAVQDARDAERELAQLRTAHPELLIKGLTLELVELALQAAGGA